MTSRADIDRLNQATANAVSLARDDLSRFLSSLDLTQPEVVRDELIDFVPRLTATYGDVAATAAAEWYEAMRSQSRSESYAALLADPADRAQVVGSVRYAAGHLFTDDPLAVLAVLNGSVQRYVAYSGRSTVARNASHDPARPRFARVPRGAKTCAFCEMLASRGWVYNTEKTAGVDPSHYHDDCDCQVVPEWERGQVHIAGYDPDAMYSRYLDAAGQVGNTTDTKAILAQMRRAYPDAYTDGVVDLAA